MAYTTEDKIKAMFRNIDIGANTAVTTTEVATFIEEADAYIDSKLYDYYETPVTGTESLKILSVISTYFVAHRIKTILELNKQNSDKNQEVQTNLQKIAEKMLNDLIPQTKMCGGKCVTTEPILKLTDAVSKEFAPSTASVTSYKSGLTKTFEKGGDNW
jgi:predicted metal-dependent hydrolase